MGAPRRPELFGCEGPRTRLHRFLTMCGAMESPTLTRGGRWVGGRRVGVLVFHWQHPGPCRSVARHQAIFNSAARATERRPPVRHPSASLAALVHAKTSLSSATKGALENPRGSRYSESPPPSANRIRAHMAFIWACCAVVSGTTFLGLQFQMDWVGAVSFLS